MPASVDQTKLEQTARAHLAVCELLESTALSDQTKRQLQNLRRLLELEISAIRSTADAENQGQC